MVGGRRPGRVPAVAVVRKSGTADAGELVIRRAADRVPCAAPIQVGFRGRIPFEIIPCDLAIDPKEQSIGQVHRGGGGSPWGLIDHDDGSGQEPVKCGTGDRVGPVHKTADDTGDVIAFIAVVIDVGGSVVAAVERVAPAVLRITVAGLEASVDHGPVHGHGIDARVGRPILLDRVKISLDHGCSPAGDPGDHHRSVARPAVVGVPRGGVGGVPYPKAGIHVVLRDVIRIHEIGVGWTARWIVRGGSGIGG